MFSSNVMPQAIPILPSKPPLYPPLHRHLTLLFQTNHPLPIKTHHPLQVLFHIPIHTLHFQPHYFHPKLHAAHPVQPPDLFIQF
ncbi:PTS glucose transporter subunit IIA, partial [Bacillus sp. WP8]|uniref:PTS glucose transporter subunit IIA n=1 Tax=Bacillus sp. WP8 TaxID=756828 RepID=UPI0037BF9304